MKKNRAFWKKDRSSFSAEQDKVIREALKFYEAKELDYLQNQEELHGSHTPSPEFEQKMERLFQETQTQLQAGKRKNMHSFIRIPKAALVAACAMIITIIFVGIQTEAIPFPKFNYTLRKEDGAYAYLIEQEKYVKDTVEEIYEVTYVPKDYTLQETEESKLSYYMNFINKNDDVYIYQQTTKKILTRVDEILKDYKEMIFDKSRYYVLDRDNDTRIVWYANGYQYFIQADLPINELVQSAQSIELQ